MILNERGSITVEAAVVFPFFLMVILLLVNMIHIAMVQVAMDHSVNEVAKQIAAYSFPLRDISDKVTLPDILNAGYEPTDGDNYMSSFFPGAGTLLQAFQEYLRSGAGGILEKAVKNFVGKEIKAYYPLARLPSEENFQISEFKIYNPLEKSSGADEDIIITIDYRVKINIPFCPLKEIQLRSTAMEMAWVD